MFVTRDANNNIDGAFAREQFENQEYISLDDPALVTFLNTPR